MAYDMAHLVLRGARVIAVDHMSKRYRQTGKLGNEEAITELITANASPPMLYYEFTKREEARLGADWIWWFVEPDGEAFGTLIQAKKLVRTSRAKGPTSWRYGFDYRDGEQIKALIRSAEDLRVPATYALYSGGTEYREKFWCTRDHAELPCERCERIGVSLVSALCVNREIYPKNDFNAAHRERVAQTVFYDALPLEDIIGADTGQPDLQLFSRTQELHEDLVAFFDEPQSGAREIARSLIARLCELRIGQMGAVSGDVTTLDSAPVFPVVPADRGHFTEPFMRHVLRGLRKEPPDYVVDILEGRSPQPSLAAHVNAVLVTELLPTAADGNVLRPALAVRPTLR